MNGGPCQTICVTVEDYSQDFSALQPDYLFYLLVELERLVAVEYIKVFLLIFNGITLQRILKDNLFSRKNSKVTYRADL